LTLFSCFGVRAATKVRNDGPQLAFQTAGNGSLGPLATPELVLETPHPRKRTGGALAADCLTGYAVTISIRAAVATNAPLIDGFAATADLPASPAAGIALRQLIGAVMRRGLRLRETKRGRYSEQRDG